MVRTLTSAIRIANTDGHPSQAFAQAFLAEFFTDEVFAPNAPWAPPTESGAEESDNDLSTDESQAGELDEPDDETTDPFAGNGEREDLEVGGDAPASNEPVIPPAPESPDYEWRTTRDGRRTAIVQGADGQTLHLVQGDDQLSVLDADGNLIAITEHEPQQVAGPPQPGAVSAWQLSHGYNGRVYATEADLLRTLQSGGRAVLQWATQNGLRVVIQSAATAAVSPQALIGTLILTYSPETGGRYTLTGENIRFDHDESLTGTLYQRGADGQWEAVRNNVRMDQLTDEEHARLMPPPGQNPNQPVGAPPPTPYPDQSDEVNDGTALPGQDTDEVDEGWNEGFDPAPDMGPPYFESSPNGNTENNEQLANQRHQAGTDLQDPQALVGTNTPDGGTYGYPNEPRIADNDAARYAEDVTGLPTGIEVNLGGTHEGNGRIVDGVWLDGIRVETDPVTGASVQVYLEVKHWEGYSTDLPWVSHDIRRDLNNQLRHLPAGARLEWVVSNSATEQAVRVQLQSVPAAERARVQITIRPNYR